METATSTSRKIARMIADIDAAAAQRDSYGKLARMAETLPNMGYEVDRLWNSYNEFDGEVDHLIEKAIEAGATPEMMDA